MSRPYRFGSAKFIGPWTEEEAEAFSLRVLEIMDEQLELAAIAAKKVTLTVVPGDAS